MSESEAKPVVENPTSDFDEDLEDEETGAYDNLKKIAKSQRYFGDENPTIKCHNCRQFGHMAKECPNETKKSNCILCGKDTHDSFECNEKMCFKCNQVGHEARNCTEKNITTCNRCGHIGHKETRCLKEWRDKTHQQLKAVRCIQCDKFGHIKCTSEKQSKQIKIDAKVMNDLNEFIIKSF